MCAYINSYIYINTLQKVFQDYLSAEDDYLYLEVSAFPRTHGTLANIISGHFSFASSPLI